MECYLIAIRGAQCVLIINTHTPCLVLNNKGGVFYTLQTCLSKFLGMHGHASFILFLGAWGILTIAHFNVDLNVCDELNVNV